MAHSDNLYYLIEVILVTDLNITAVNQAYNTERKSGKRSGIIVEILPCFSVKNYRKFAFKKNYIL